jgi:transposase
LKVWAKRRLAGDTLVYLDETGFELSSQRDYGRALKGHKVYGARSGHKRPRTGLLGALIAGRLAAPMLFEGTCNTQTFNTWLATFLAPRLHKGMTLIMDNATFHRSAKTQQIIAAAGCHLLFLPPYSPELNPIEKTWANLKRQRKYRAHLSLDQLVASVA